MKRPPANQPRTEGVFMAHTRPLAEAFTKAPGKARTWIGECHLFYEKQFREATHHQPEGTAAGLHDAVDFELKAFADESPKWSEVTCRKGCAHCCKQNVDVTLQEAALLIHAANEAGFTFDAQRLERQQAVTAWKELAPEDRACIFLAADDTCTVYEHRPMSCRKYQVISPPDDCDTIKKPGHRTAVLFSITAEIVTSAAFTVFASGPMPKMIKRAQLLPRDTD